MICLMEPEKIWAVLRVHTVNGWGVPSSPQFYVGRDDVPEGECEENDGYTRITAQVKGELTEREAHELVATYRQ